jgi:DNA repair protein RadC
MSGPGLQPSRPRCWPKRPDWLRVVREPSQLEHPTQIMSPRTAVELLRAHGALREEVEVMYALLLDAQNRVRALVEVSRGTLNSSLVHPREVFRLAIVYGAAGVIVGHNHPSGQPNPSTDDKAVTAQLVDAGRLLDIPLYDHVIIADDGYFSFVEAGLL